MLSTSTSEKLVPHVLCQGHSVTDRDVVIPWSPYEHSQSAPTGCYCHYGDAEDRRTMTAGHWMQ